MIQYLLDGRLADVHDGKPLTMPGMELLRAQLIQGDQRGLDFAQSSRSSPSSLLGALPGSSWRSINRLRSPSTRWRLGWGTCSHRVLVGLDVGGGERWWVRDGTWDTAFLLLRGVGHSLLLDPGEQVQ